MPTISDAIRHGQREIRRQEGVTFARLLTEYEQVWWYVERIIRRYESQIQDAIDAGETVSPSWLRQQRWYTQLQTTIDAELVRFNRSALGTINASQAAAVGIASESATMFAGAISINPGIVARVNAPAFERWVSALRPGSPLRGVLDRFDSRVTRAIERHITDGIGAGEGINTIVRRIVQDVGPVGQEGYLQTVARTEVHRAMRGAHADIYGAFPKGVIAGYQWRSARDQRTCILCLVKDGTISRDYPTTQHIACRCHVWPVPNAKLVPPVGRPRESGLDWFERQPENVKRSIMPTQAHWELYEQGVSPEQFVGIKRSRTWGDSIRLVPASALRRAS